MCIFHIYALNSSSFSFFSFLLKGFMAPIVHDLSSSSVRQATIPYLYHSRRYGLTPNSTARIITMVWQLPTAWTQLSFRMTFQSGLVCTEMVKTNTSVWYIFCELHCCNAIMLITTLYLLKQTEGQKNPSLGVLSYFLVLNIPVFSHETNNGIWQTGNRLSPPLWWLRFNLHFSGETWTWGTGLSEYRNWTSGEPGNNSDCVSISSLTKEMATQNCSAQFPFVCFKDNLVLVKENKTWEEALEYCRALTSSNPYNSDLVSVQPGEDHNDVMYRAAEAVTEKVG